MESLDELNNFLSDVDKISQLVTDLQSSDAAVQQKAMLQADGYSAGKTGINKTTINTNPSRQTSSLTTRNESPESFMKIMEQDAEDRRLKRAAKEEKANALKNKGNEAYAQEDYNSAVKYYSEGLAEVKDMQALYTNRAQAYIKLGKYKDAISDCEWALKCNERCIKAYLHMGKAYLALKKYNEARSSFEKLKELQPNQEKMAKEYLAKVALEEEREAQETLAKQELARGATKATAVAQLLQKLSESAQEPHYYVGGLEILTLTVSDCSGKTVFRLSNGFSIVSSNATLKSYLLWHTSDPHIQELSVSIFKLWRTVCCENNENQRLLITCPLATESMLQSVTSEHPAIRKHCLDLICLYSENPVGRCLAIDNLNVSMLVKNLLICISKFEQQQETAVSILRTLANESRIHHQLRNVVTDAVIVPFANILRNIRNQHVVPALISTIGFLANDDVICHALANDPECWVALLFSIQECCACERRDVLYALLGFIIKISTNGCSAIQLHAVSLCDYSLGLLKDKDEGIITRATGVLCTVLAQSSTAVQHAIQKKVVDAMIHVIKGTNRTATKYAIKALTVCTAENQLAREELVKADRMLSSLRYLLSSSCDEMVTGNAALCLAHCFDLEGVACLLLGTDIVLLLLRQAAGYAKRKAVQQNAAIALGKLCRADPRHRDKLQELHGLEILHSCVKLLP